MSNIGVCLVLGTIDTVPSDGRRRTLPTRTTPVLDDRLAGLQATPALGIVDDRQRQPVLDRADGVEGLDLRVHLDVAGSDSLQLDHRRVANGVENVVVDHKGIIPEGGAVQQTRDWALLASRCSRGR